MQLHQLVLFDLRYYVSTGTCKLLPIFQAPQPAQTWDGVLNTTYLDVSCYQQQGDLSSDSEDCLFVNVYTPTVCTFYTSSVKADDLVLYN